MKRRSETVVSSDFGIFDPVKHFAQPPCEPPKGCDVLRRMFFEIGFKDKVRISVSNAALAVAEDLLQLWRLGDSNIALLSRGAIAKRIEDFHRELTIIRSKSWSNRTTYAKAVRLVFFQRILFLYNYYPLCSMHEYGFSAL